MDEVTAVAIPSVEQEAARDLVRARDDCRGDLMRARNRLSKLLLRRGIVYYGGRAWTGRHDAWLRGQARGQLIDRATLIAFDNDNETVWAVQARRTASTPRSRRWPRTASSLRWSAGWGAFGASAP